MGPNVYLGFRWIEMHQIKLRPEIKGLWLYEEALARMISEGYIRCTTWKGIEWLKLK